MGEPAQAPAGVLRWAVVNSLAVVAFLAAVLSYHGHVHAAGRVAAALVLSVFVLASAYCGVLAWRADTVAARGLDERSLEHVGLAIRVCPIMLMLERHLLDERQ